MVKYSTILFILFSCFVFSQDPYFERYSIQEGLPTSNVYSIFEDTYGYIWFTTDIGLLRYDGYNFINYTTDNGLVDNEIFRIFQDSKNRLWFLSLNGKLGFHKDGKFYNTFTNEFLKQASYDNMIVDIIEDKNNRILILFKDGRISIIDDEKVEIISEEKISSFALWNSANQLLVLNIDYIKDINTGKQVSIHKNNNVNSKVFIRSAKADNGDYFYTITGSVYKFQKGVSKFIFKLNSEEIINLSIIDNQLYIGTRNGLFIKNENTIEHYYKKDQISDVFKDSQGNLWVSTLDDGIKFMPNTNVFNTIFNSKNKIVNSLLTDSKKNLWSGTFDGTYKKGTNTETVKLLNNHAFGFRQIDESIFIFSDELFIFSENKFKKLPIRINDAIKTKSHYILATSSYVLNIEHKDFEDIIKHPSVFNTKFKKYIAFKKRVNFLFENNEVIYVGTHNGLFYLKDEVLVRISPNNKALESGIVDMIYDDKNRLSLIATQSSGILLIKNYKVVKQLKTSENLNSNLCNKIIKIYDNNYLVATNKGLNTILVKNDAIEVENINPILGIKDLNVKDIEMSEETINVASSKGLLSFNKSILKNKNKEIPKLLLNSITVNGKTVDDLDQLNYTQNNITFNYTGLSYSCHGDITYEYKLNEDQTWFETKSRTIVLNSLQPKNYTFSIRAKGANDLLSETKIMHFKIYAPLWKTPAFITLFSALILSVIIYFFKQKIDKQNIRFQLERETFKNKQEKILLEKVAVELEQKVLRLQMNPHFIFNALNTIKGYYSVGDIKDANIYINKFSKLLRLILEHQSKLVSLEKELEMLKLYINLLQLRYQNEFVYSIEISKELEKDILGIPPLLLQPIVENAIIHGIAPNTGVKGVLKIQFEIENKKLLCKVVDNGIGFIKSEQGVKKLHKSKAIKITQERIDLVNDFKDPRNFEIIHFENPTGTKVIIKLPIIKLW